MATKATRLRKSSSKDKDGDDNNNDNRSLFVNEKCGKLGNFLALSEKAKSRARSSMRRQSSAKYERNSRKSNILSSLDKFLDDDVLGGNGDYDTETTSYQSSFSSGLDSESAPVARKLPPRVEPTLEGEEEASSASIGNPTTPRRRFARRGSVTKYSLHDQQQQQTNSDDHHRHHPSPSEKKKKNHKLSSPPLSLSSSSHQKNHVEAVHSASSRPSLSRKPQHNNNNGGSNRSIDRSNRSLDKSSRSIDERPLPMREASIQSLRSDADEGSASTTIDDIPLPMKWSDSTTSLFSENSFTTTDSFEKGTGGGTGRRPVLSQRMNSKKSYESCGSTATLSSFDDDDDDDSTSHQHQQQSQPLHQHNRLPPKPKRNSLAGLSNLSGGATPADNDHRLQDDRSLASQSVASEGGRQRYRRRGSVTKYSLGGGGGESKSFDSSDGEHHLPPRPHRPSVSSSSGQQRPSLGGLLNALPGSSDDRRLQDDKSIKSEGRHQRYRRRGSVTQYSLDGSSDHTESSEQQQLPPRAPGHVSPTKKTRSSSSSASLGGLLKALPSASNNNGDRGGGLSSSEHTIDEKSINSEGILGGGRQRYRRRGSVTRYSLGGGGSNEEANIAASTAAATNDAEEPPRRRFNRRGSVTKYSLGG